MMDLEIIILSQKEKDKYHGITDMYNLKHDTNELIYENRNKLIDIETCGCQEGKGEEERWIGSLGLADVNYYM